MPNSLIPCENSSGGTGGGGGHGGPSDGPCMPGSTAPCGDPGGGFGHPKPPPPPSPPLPTPRDCSREQQQVQNDSQRVNGLDGRLRNLKDQERNVRWQMQAIEGRVRQEVDRISNDLDARVQEAQSRTNDAQNRIGSLQRQINDNRDQMAQLQSSLDSAQNQKPILLNQRAQAQRNLSDAEASWNNFDRANGFSAIESSYLAASRAVQQNQQQLGAARAQVQQIQVKVTDLQNQLFAQGKVRDTLLGQLVKAQTALAETQRQLVPMRDQEQILNQQILQEKIVIDQVLSVVQRAALARNL